MTGRRGRVVCLPDGTIQYQLRAEAEISVELLNITEKQRFMDGEKVWFILHCVCVCVLIALCACIEVRFLFLRVWPSSRKLPAQASHCKLTEEPR